MANQSVSGLGGIGCLEKLTDVDDRLFDMRGHLLGERMGHSGSVAEIGLRMASVLGPPFAEPTQTAFQGTTNIDTVLSLQATANGFLA